MGKDESVIDCLRSLTPEELAKVTPISEEEIAEAIAKGEEELAKARQFGSSFRVSGLYYR